MKILKRVSLQAITDKNREAVVSLSVSENQRVFVADNAKTMRQAGEAPEAWLRAIYADDDAVGLVLVHDEHLREQPRESGYYFLWRLMIDHRFQKSGYGSRALDLVVNYVRSRPHARRLLSSYHAGPGGPEAFYLRYGFRPTGNIVEGEVEIELSLDKSIDESISPH